QDDERREALPPPAPLSLDAGEHGAGESLRAPFPSWLHVRGLGGEVARQRLELRPRARVEGQVEAVRELLERQPAVDRMQPQGAGGLLPLRIRSANGWRLVAQGSR